MIFPPEVGRGVAYQDGHGQLLPDVVQGSHIRPCDVGHGGEALALGGRLHAGQGRLKVGHEDAEAGELLFREGLAALQESQQARQLPLLVKEAFYEMSEIVNRNQTVTTPGLLGNGNSCSFFPSPLQVPL